VISQDLTVFDITADAVVARQRTLDPMSWAVVVETKQPGPPMSTPHDPPAWWADALITD
jgi:ribonuclease Z